MSFHHLGIVCLNRGGCHHGIGPTDVLCIMSHAGVNAHGLQSPQHGTVSDVCATDGIAQVVQNFGDAAHARTTDTDKMHMANRVLHAVTSSHTATTSWVAVVLRKP